MSGLNFSLGGKLDPSYKASLNQAAAEAEAAGMRIQNSLRKQISGLDRLIAGGTGGPEAETKRAALQKNLLMVQNAQYVDAARKRQAILEGEKAAEAARYDLSSHQIQNVRANLEAENAAMLKNRDALKALIAERRAAAAEAARYNISQTPGSGFANPRAGDAADNSRMSRFSGALKASIAASNAKNELVRYNQSTGVSVLELAKSGGSMASNLDKAAHSAGGLNLIIRETLVVFREIGRGNWTRVPGSLSLIAQGFSTLKGISLATLGAWGVAIGGIIGSVFIYFHRVKQLAKDLTTTLVSAFAPEHIARYMSRLEVLNQLHKDVADSARQIQEAHDGVGDSIQRELELTKSKIAFERELLEAQKANALAAVKNPAEREAIEKKYSALMLANKKKERDAEFKSLQDEVKKLPGEIGKTEAEIKRLTEGGGFMSEAQQNQILKQKQEASDAYKEYRQQLSPGEKDKRETSADRDRKIIADFNKKQANFNKSVDENKRNSIFYTITDTDRARRNAAQERLAESDRTKRDLNSFIDSADERTHSRARVKELEDRVKADQDRLAKLGPRGGGLVEDTLKKNLQQDKQDLALENERLKRVDAGRPLGGREVTERERVGFGSPQIALLDVNRSMDRKLAILVQHAQRGGAGGVGSFGNGAPSGFGD